MSDAGIPNSAADARRRPEAESSWRVIVQAVREAPSSTRRVLALNIASALLALAVAAFATLGEGPGELLRLGGLAVGFVGIFLVTLAYVLHHLSQSGSASCMKIAFFRLQYRQLSRDFVALPLLALLAAVCLAVAATIYGIFIFERPVLIVVVALFVANLALAIRSVSQTSRFLYTHAREQAEAAERARAQAVEAQLAALQAQMNPHFLFNALNTVASLVRTDSAAAEASVENLAEILRRTLARSRRQMTTLRDELDYLKAYLALEKERWGERLEVEWEIDPEALELSLPPMMLQPLVENALRHGIGARLDGGRIRVSASRHNGKLRLAVFDDGVGFPTRHREGTGLGNLRERIATLYGADSSLDIETDGNGTRVLLELPAEGGSES